MPGPAVIIPAVLAVASMALQAQASSKQAQQQAGLASYQNKVAQNNSILAERAAQREEQLGDISASNQAAKTRQLMGTQRATFAANGVLVDSGSALDTTGDTAALGELDQLTIKDNAAQRAAALRAQGANFSAEANSNSGPGFDFGGALSNVGQVASKWYDYGDKAGWFTPSAPAGGGYNYSGGEFAGTGSSY